LEKIKLFEVNTSTNRFAVLSGSWISVALYTFIVPGGIQLASKFCFS